MVVLSCWAFTKLGTEGRSPHNPGGDWVVVDLVQARTVRGGPRCDEFVMAQLGICHEQSDSWGSGFVAFSVHTALLQL